MGDTEVCDARELKELETENDRLKHMVAEPLLVIEELEEFAGKK